MKTIQEMQEELDKTGKITVSDSAFTQSSPLWKQGWDARQEEVDALKKRAEKADKRVMDHMLEKYVVTNNAWDERDEWKAVAEAWRFWATEIVTRKGIQVGFIRMDLWDASRMALINGILNDADKAASK